MHNLSQYDWSGERVRRRRTVALVLKTAAAIVLLAGIASAGALYIH